MIGDFDTGIKFEHLNLVSLLWLKHKAGIFKVGQPTSATFFGWFLGEKEVHKVHCRTKLTNLFLNVEYKYRKNKLAGTRDTPKAGVQMAAYRKAGVRSTL